MIGVILESRDISVAEEFFQLFKTPWERYRDGMHYDVVIACNDVLPKIAPRLLIQYGSENKSGETPGDSTALEPPQEQCLNYADLPLPVYGKLRAFRAGSSCLPLLALGSQIVAFKFNDAHGMRVRIGYDLFKEIEFLLAGRQPAKWSQIPALDYHIAVLRDAILSAGLPLVEIPPLPARHTFFVCLTHDIDFVGIRNHLFDHTMWGFLYRSTIGSIRSYVTGKISFSRLLKTIRAAGSLPFVYLGLTKDFWLPFEWYLREEKDLASTYFFIPFKNRPGDKLSSSHAARRAAKYDIFDVADWVAKLTAQGCEIGVHGIDSWHSIAAGREEMSRIASVSGAKASGIRMHWLMQDEDTFRLLEEAGYLFDSTGGYNDTIGYRYGTTQVFRPLGRTRLLELPLHIQDGALFYPHQLGLTEPAARVACDAMIDRARAVGGVLTILWHDRSHGPERFWGGFYINLLKSLKATRAWFGTASQIVDWFRCRRDVRFLELTSPDGSTTIEIVYDGAPVKPPFIVRARAPAGNSCEAGRREKISDTSWTGQTTVAFCTQSGQVHRAPSSTAGVDGRQSTRSV